MRTTKMRMCVLLFAIAGLSTSCHEEAVTSYCSPATCVDLGYSCGTYANGTCADTIDCGDCSTGYTCIEGSCVVPYYVDKDGISGPCNDIYTKEENNPSHPWCTIQKAADLAVAGDTIYVMDATYDERVTFSSGHSGSLGKKITFKAKTPRSVTMQGFNTENADYLRIEGFNITNVLYGWLGGGIWVSSDFVEIADNYFYDLHGSAIQSNWVEPWPQSTLITGNRVYHSGAGFFVVCQRDCLIENNEVERLFQYETGFDADYSRFNGEYITFRNNYFHGMIQSEIGTSHVDCWQTFDTSGGYSHNIVIEDNTCSDCHEGFMGSCLDSANVSNIIFRRNIVSNSAAWGMSVENVPGLTITQNTFATIVSHGVGFRMAGATNETVKNNIFYDMQSSYWTDDGAQLEDADYNLIYLANDPSISGPHNLIGVDPLFVDPANNDFRLQPGSPACGMGEGGIDIGAIPCDEGS